MRLVDLPLNVQAIVKDIKVNKELALRLYNMGFRVGNKVKVVRVAPMQDPIEVLTKGFYIALRKKDAFNILVERL